MSQRAHDADFMRRTAENYERYFVPSIGGPVAADLMKRRAFVLASMCSTLPAVLG